jgi:YbbR domain-containing protein
MGIRELTKKYVLNELKLKILALAIAVLLWVSTTYIGESKIAMSVPVSFENLQRNMVVRESNTRNVFITMNGSLTVLKGLQAGDVKVPLDLARAREGRHILTIRKGDVMVPTGVKIEDLKPDYVVVEVDKIVEKRLRTVVKLDKKWAGIYEIASWYPHYVDVEGPRELLEKRDVLEVPPVEGNFVHPEEVVDIPLTKSLEARRMKPETARVVLKRIAK